MSRTQEDLSRQRRRVRPQQPDYRNKTEHGDLQFVCGYTGGGAQACEHMTMETYRQRIEAKAGPGTLVEEDGVFYWERKLTNDEAPFTPGEAVTFCGLAGIVVSKQEQQRKNSSRKRAGRLEPKG